MSAKEYSQAYREDCQKFRNAITDREYFIESYQGMAKKAKHLGPGNIVETICANGVKECEAEILQFQKALEELNVRYRAICADLAEGA